MVFQRVGLVAFIFRMVEAFCGCQRRLRFRLRRLIAIVCIRLVQAAQQGGDGLFGAPGVAVGFAVQVFDEVRIGPPVRIGFTREIFRRAGLYFAPLRVRQQQGMRRRRTEAWLMTVIVI